jgi:hypothetical protein
VRLSWENATAKVEYTFLLRAGEDRIFLDIAYTPGSRCLRFCLWDFDSWCSHAVAEKRFLKALDGARAELGREATFAIPFSQKKTNAPALPNRFGRVRDGRSPQNLPLRIQPANNVFLVSHIQPNCDTSIHDRSPFIAPLSAFLI